MSAPSPVVAFLTGPTAVGKSAVGFALAEEFGWELLSIDSRQIYRGLAIGTAKPTESERTRIRHHLLDLLDPGETASAGWFGQRYAETCADLAAQGARGLAVGGTGLYWEAATRGLHPLPPPSPELRAELEAIAAHEGVPSLHRRLAALDPEGAVRIDPQNRHRVIRALELVRLTGLPLGALYAGSRETSGPTDPNRSPIAVVLLRPRDELHARIEARCAQMVAAGLLDEIRGLLATGVPPDAPGLRTVGYRELLPHLLGGVPLAVCLHRFVVATRQYAKRQETWFRNRLAEKVVVPLPAGAGDEEAVERVRAALEMAGGPGPARGS